MFPIDTDQFLYLWDGTEPGWVLIHDGAREWKTIYNVETSFVLLIEIDKLHDAVVERMIAEGVEILDQMPPEKGDLDWMKGADAEKGGPDMSETGRGRRRKSRGLV